MEEVGRQELDNYIVVILCFVPVISCLMFKHTKGLSHQEVIFYGITMESFFHALYSYDSLGRFLELQPCLQRPLLEHQDVEGDFFAPHFSCMGLRSPTWNPLSC